MATQLVWLKRDLRIHDHAPLAEAARRGPCICLYVFEPELLEQPESDGSHFQFILACLGELRRALRERGGELVIRRGALPEVFDELLTRHPFEAIWSHEETGNARTYARDRRVARWARERGIPWHEFPQTGVIRRLTNRDGWSREWNRRMKAPLIPAPARIHLPSGLSAARLPSLKALGFGPGAKSELQAGGESVALATLDSFLEHRGVNYSKDMSSPVTAWDGCSRLSPYLAYGAISMKTVHQTLEARRDEVRALRGGENPPDRRWLGSLSSFAARLRWHCHFMQKLEDEPRIEFENLARACDGLREDDWDPARFDAWCAGQTGFPMVDACIRALHARSWINFRMRAMLMSFAAYDLWLHWREPSIFLARHFLDFEPGIHFSQAQMQSGTTGINTMRIYSPAKQVKDHDPEGRFIRRWVPELEGVPAAWLAEPHTMPLDLQRKCGCRIGQDYPAPIVDHAAAVAEARRRLSAARRTAEARREAAGIVEKHGSRKGPGMRRGRRPVSS